MCLFVGDKGTLATSHELKSCRRLIWHSALTRNVIECESRAKEKDFHVAFVFFLLFPPFRGNLQIGVNNDLWLLSLPEGNKKQNTRDIKCRNFRLTPRMRCVGAETNKASNGTRVHYTACSVRVL